MSLFFLKLCIKASRVRYILSVSNTWLHTQINSQTVVFRSFRSFLWKCTAASLTENCDHCRLGQTCPAVSGTCIYLPGKILKGPTAFDLGLWSVISRGSVSTGFCASCVPISLKAELLIVGVLLAHTVGNKGVVSSSGFGYFKRMFSVSRSGSMAMAKCYISFGGPI